MNRRSRAPEARGIPGFPTSCLRARSRPCRRRTSCDVRRRTDLLGTLKSAQRELNPHFRHGKATGCRYIMGALWCAELSRNKSTGRDSNSRRRITGAVSSPLDDQCNPSITSVGPEGLEPSPGGLRVRCAAASTLIPCSAFTCARSGRGGNRTLDPVLIRDLLSPLSYAPHRVGPKGLEPLLAGLKVRCAAVTPRPQNVAGRIRFNRVWSMLLLLVSSGSPESRTQRYAVISRVRATGPRLPFANVVISRSGRRDSNPRSSCSQGTRAAAALHPCHSSQNGRI